MPETSVVIAGLALAGTLFASWLTYRGSKAATRVGMEANAFQRAQEAEKKAVAAEGKAEDAERRADALNARMRKMESSMVSLESRLRYIILLIHDPYISLELLRERVPLNFNTARREEEHDER